MIDDKVFTELMERLETSYNHKLPLGAHRVWKTELERMGVTTESMARGVDEAIDAGDKYFPTSGSLAKTCNRLRKAKQEAEMQVQRRVNSERETQDWKENAVERGGKLAADCVDLIRNLADEAVMPGKDFYYEMMKLEKKHPNLKFKRKAREYADQHKKRVKP